MSTAFDENKMQIIEGINNKDALIRRVEKMLLDFDRYPLMPEGDLTSKFIENVFSFNPLFVLDELKKQIMDVLWEETGYQYDEQVIRTLFEYCYARHEKRLKQKVYDSIKRCFIEDMDRFSFRHDNLMRLRPVETQIFYYAFSLYYIGKDLKDGERLLFARKALKGVELICCDKNHIPYFGVDKSGWMLSLKQFSDDRAVFENMLEKIEDEIASLSNQKFGEILEKEKEKEPKRKSKNSVLKWVVILIVAYFIYKLIRRMLLLSFLV